MIIRVGKIPEGLAKWFTTKRHLAVFPVKLNNTCQALGKMAQFSLPIIISIVRNLKGTAQKKTVQTTKSFV